MFDDQPHIFDMPNPRFGVAKPETFRVPPDERGSALDQFRRRRGGRREFVQFIGRSSHTSTLQSARAESKNVLAMWRVRASV
ncbi:MAG TPA: hypothetical protein VGK40_06550 [Verrucomicrobiae bacterium]|jgi:hypothetical protein